MRKRIAQIEHFKNNPEVAQNQVFKQLINTGKKTVFGQEHNFSTIAQEESLSLFQSEVPVRDYEDLKPYIERIKKGEKDILWPGFTKWFAVSSGTTASFSKFIPVSKESLELCHFRGGKDVILRYCQLYPDTKVTRTKSLVIGGSRQVENIGSNQYYGDLSAVIIDNLPIWAHLLRTPARSVALIPEWEVKLEKMTESSIKQNVSNIMGVPSWTLVLLKKILARTGKSNIKEVWSNFELFVHGGVSFEPYREEFKRLLPPNTRYMETYNASEGFFAYQDDLSEKNMLLVLDSGIFYEFIPLDRIDEENPPVYTIGDVKVGVNYAIIISTNGGLWRYQLGDTVQFTSLYPHKIVITGRVKHFINAFGEELIINNAEQALKAASNATGAYINDYTAAPVYMSKDSTGRHEWLIEFSSPPSDLDEFTRILDAELQKVNSDYAAKRYKNLTLQMPRVHRAKKDLFQHWLKQKGKLGGQNKVPRLYNSRKFIDELLQLNES